MSVHASRYSVEGKDYLTVPAPPSKRDILRADTEAIPVTAAVIGVLSLAAAVGGGLTVLLVSGVRTPQQLTDGLTSSGMTLTLGIGIALGLVSLLIGLLCYPHANTRVARRQASTGAILGVQGVLVGTFGIVFVHGDMTTFTRVFLNFPQVVSWFPFFVTGFYNTIILTLVSTAVGIGLGLVISMFLLSSRRILRVPARAYVNVLRGTPMLIELAIVYFGLALGLRLSLSPFVAMIVALSLNASSYMAETFRGGLQSIARGQLEAARSLGLTHWQALQHVAIPQAFRRVIPPVMNNFIFIAKETSLLAFLGVALGNRDLYSVASQGYSQFFNSTFFIAAAAGYLLVTLPLIGLVNLAEKKVHSGLVGIGSEG